MSANNFSSTLLPEIIEAGLNGNTQRLQMLALTAVRRLKQDDPAMADKIGAVLARLSSSASALRWKAAEPPPVDADAGLALLRLESTADATEPILTPEIEDLIVGFLSERKSGERLLHEGFAPPKSLLLTGKPGTGKTMLAQWLARELGLPLVALDLATSISSYLGKTGANLRRSLDYARATPCVLLLDEFDSIAKRRDDATELGELKRIVNVLLKELEEWPLHSVLVAATNHPELLDHAISRRFDLVVPIPLPTTRERARILERALGRLSQELPEGFIDAIAGVESGLSGSDLDRIARTAARTRLLKDQPLSQAVVDALVRSGVNIAKHDLGPLVRALKKATNLSVRELAEVFGKSSSAIQYQIKKPIKPLKSK